MPTEPEATNKIDPPIEVKIPGYVETERFASWQQVKRFIDEELEAWRWLENEIPKTNLQPLKTAANDQWAQIVRIRTSVDVALKAESTDEKMGHTEDVRGRVKLYEEGKFISAKGPDGQALVSIAVTDPEAAIGALAFLRTEKWTLDGPAWRPVMRGVGLLYISRLDGSIVQDTAAAMEALRSDWAAKFEKQRNDAEETTTQLAAVRDKDIPKAQERVAKFWVDQGNKSREHFREAHERLDTLERTFHERLRLEAPAKYWSDKASRHGLWASGAFIAFGAIVGTAAWKLFEYSLPILELLERGKTDGIPIGNIVLITLPALAFFWFLRFIARLFVVNLQRLQDAQERATLVETYLALVAEGPQVATEEERFLVLNSIFRPGPGDTPSDGPPSDLLDIIKRLSSTR